MDGSAPTKEPAFIVDGTGYEVKALSFQKWLDLTKVSIGKGLLGPRGGSCGGKGGSCDGNGGRGGSMAGRGGKSLRESKNVCGEVGGVEKISSTGSKFMVRGEECLEGCVGAGGGEVNRGGDYFRVSKSLLGEIPGVAIGKISGETFGVDGGAI
ncbi:hypothetical protein Tco_0264755 [Tanacetum coccineum]